MSFNRKLTNYSECLTKDVATGQAVSEEGTILVYVENNGVKQVQYATGSATETLAGFCALDNYQPTTTVVVESGIVPSTRSITLSHSNLVQGQVRISDLTTGLDLPVIYTGSTTSVNKALVTVSTGVIQFDASVVVSDSLLIYYRRNITVQESTLLYFNRFANAGASSDWGVCEVMGGQGEIWTDCFDASQNYANLGSAYVVPSATVPGYITTSTANSNGRQIGLVIHAPTADSPWLGIKFTLANKYAQ